MKRLHASRVAWAVLALFWTSVTLATPANAEAPGAVVSEDAKLEAFFRAYLDATFAAQPVMATGLGDHRFDDRMDDLSPEARAANVQRDRQTLADLPLQIHQDQLTPNGRVDFAIFAHHLTREIWLAEHFHPFEDDPRAYGAYLTDTIYNLLTQSSLPKATNLANATARMAHVPEIVATARKTITNPPRVKTETAIRQTRGAIHFYTDDLFALAGQPKGEGELGKNAEAAANALKDHLAFLETTILPRSGDAWRIGPELFAQKLELELDAGLTADEVRDEAQAEATRVEREMATIARQLWGTTHPNEPIPPDDEAGRRTLIRKVLAKLSEDHGTTETLMADVRETVGQVKAFIQERDILRLPDPDRCRIVEMPEFLRGNSTAYLNPSPPLDPQGSSEYAISPPPSDWTAQQVASYFREYDRPMLKILTIHEAYPGHYVQLEYSNRCPSLIRRVLSSGTFAEGWAVYTEQVMLDQGFGHGDLSLRLHQLKFYLRAVINAILDREMQAGQMTDAQAMELLTGRAFQSEGEALGKIIRSKQSACQLSTYFVGRTAFTRLRRAIQNEQGDRFDLGRYHEAVLSHGTLPVKYLPALVRERLSQVR